MGDPANFGIAKSFVMMGLERGFDLSSEEGINEWMARDNAEITAGTGASMRSSSATGYSSRKQGTSGRRTARGNRNHQSASPFVPGRSNHVQPQYVAAGTQRHAGTFRRHHPID